MIAQSTNWRRMEPFDGRRLLGIQVTSNRE